MAFLRLNTVSSVGKEQGPGTHGVGGQVRIPMLGPGKDWGRRKPRKDQRRNKEVSKEKELKIGRSWERESQEGEN